MMEEERSRFESDMVGEWEDSQCKGCIYNDKTGFNLCDKHGLKPDDYMWNRMECQERRTK